MTDKDSLHMNLSATFNDLAPMLAKVEAGFCYWVPLRTNNDTGFNAWQQAHDPEKKISAFAQQSPFENMAAALFTSMDTAQKFVDSSEAGIGFILRMSHRDPTHRDVKLKAEIVGTRQAPLKP